MKTFEDFYVKKDYSSALSVLQKNANNIPTDLLHYNLGTVYSRMENWASARYHFLMAQEAGLTTSALNSNLEAVETKLETGRLEKPLNGSDYYIKASLIAKDGLLTSLSLVFLVLGLLILRKSPSVKKVLGWTVIVIAPVALNFWINSWNRAVVIESQSLAEGPSAIFNTAGELPAGVMVIVKGEGEWRQIIYPSRFNGWVKQTGLKKLE